MLYTKIQPQSFLSSEEEVFYYGHGAIWFHDTEPFDQFVNIFR